MKTEDFKLDMAGLEMLADSLGYKEKTMHLKMLVKRNVIDIQSVLNFLEDNPGAVQAVFQWAEENYSSELTEDEQEEDTSGT